MTISLLVDNPKSWIMPYAQQLVTDLKPEHDIYLFSEAAEIKTGDCAFFLGCEKLVKEDILKRNKHNLVIHESALPAGKGWSPLTWQILAGQNEIPITLFEAETTVDSGPIYFQEKINFAGHELIDELREQQGAKTISLIKKFIAAYPTLTGRAQTGPESFYPRRRPQDSELDINKTIAEQFNFLRVVDNERYPAFFNYRGQKYLLKIFKDDQNIK